MNVKELIIKYIYQFKKYIFILLITGFLLPWIFILKSTYMKNIIDSLTSKNYSMNILFIFAFYQILYEMMWRITDLSQIHLCTSLKQKIIENAMNNTLKQNYTFFTKNNTSSLVQIIHQIADSSTSLVQSMAQVYRNFILILITTYNLYQHKNILIMMIIWLIIWIIFSYFHIKSATLLTYSLNEVRLNLTQYLYDIYSNIHHILTLKTQQHEVGNVKKYSTAYQKRELALKYYLFFFWMLQGIIFTIILVLGMHILCEEYINNLISIGEVTFLAAIISEIFDSSWQLIEHLSFIPEQFGRFNQGVNVLFRQVKQVEQMNLMKIVTKIPFILIEKMQFSTSYLNLTVNEKICIPQGTIVALSGHSGSGKSTLMRILLNLNDIFNMKYTTCNTDIKGEKHLKLIRSQNINIKNKLRSHDDNIDKNVEQVIFDKNLNDTSNFQFTSDNTNILQFIQFAKEVKKDASNQFYSLKELQFAKYAAYVSQSDTLFQHYSILNNIRYGNFDIDENEVYQILQDLEANDFIDKLGHNMPISQVQLSEGQKNLILIARACLQNLPILVLDEVTAALDKKLENNVLKVLENQKQLGKIIFIASHANEVIENADLVIQFTTSKVKVS